MDNISRDIFTNGIPEISDSFKENKVGFEKESLRIFEDSLSKRPHSKSLGSSLFNKFITTDFCEAQLELVTPPFEHEDETLMFLEDIHHFVSHNISDETLWPFSIPAFIEDDSEIIIANYGSSNKAKFKTLYRKGLAHRYGKIMQAISGVHFNYSLSNQIWDIVDMHSKKEDLFQIRSKSYFNIITS